ncbi:unnamed protein product [Acanthosepion pharaonis]|uniref:Uncharacterized protein n=1 Tax=Acanthosepion pharaonis TaxID=158019 RepID=A0A812DTF3_ACAPH|nr:unnamed protein product [Sepia pharaonis]
MSISPFFVPLSLLYFLLKTLSLFLSLSYILKTFSLTLFFFSFFPPPLPEFNIVPLLPKKPLLIPFFSSITSYFIFLSFFLPPSLSLSLSLSFFLPFSLFRSYLSPLSLPMSLCTFHACLLTQLATIFSFKDIVYFFPLSFIHILLIKSYFSLLSSLSLSLSLSISLSIYLSIYLSILPLHLSFLPVSFAAALFFISD